MFSVYKYYENPSLQVSSKFHNGSDDYVEVRDLVPKIKFFDAPVNKPKEIIETTEVAAPLAEWMN